MNLISCNYCGVVLDKNKLNFPRDIYTSEFSVDETKASWNGREFVAFVKCPVCTSEVLEHE
jgi:hypothetical protein